MQRVIGRIETQQVSLTQRPDALILFEKSGLAPVEPRYHGNVDGNGHRQRASCIVRCLGTALADLQAILTFPLSEPDAQMPLRTRGESMTGPMDGIEVSLLLRCYRTARK